MNWVVGIHQFRVIATNTVKGLPTPEGIHQDGEMYGAQHLINRENITGGENFIYDLNKKLICGWTQQNQFDSYFFEDDAIWHSVSPIKAKNDNLPAHRDVLIIDFVPLDELEMN